MVIWVNHLIKILLVIIFSSVISVCINFVSSCLLRYIMCIIFFLYLICFAFVIVLLLTSLIFFLYVFVVMTVFTASLKNSLSG